MSQSDVDLLPGAEDPQTAQERRVRDRRGLRITLITLGALVGLLLAGVLVVAVLLDRNIERLSDPFADLPTRPAPIVGPDAAGDPVAPGEAADGGTGSDVPADAPSGEAVTVLVLGTDSRISAGDPDQWVAGAQRTDVMMLVHLPADGESGYVMSIPRDSWVDIPGRGQAKLNAAFSYGGPTLLIQTLEQLTGVPIDHFAVTDFDSFRHITDALGGVNLTLREPLYDRRGNFLLPEGYHLLTGDQALLYVRERLTLARGDFDRVQRQQAWMRSIVNRVRDRETLQDPAKWYPVLDAITESVAVDEGLTRDRMIDLLMRVKDLSGSDLFFFTVPVDGIGTSRDGQSIVLLDDDALDGLMASVREDGIAEWIEANEDEIDRLPLVDP